MNKSSNINEYKGIICSQRKSVAMWVCDISKIAYCADDTKIS